MKSVKFREVARYVAGSRKLCGDLSEVENVLPWRRKSGKGGKAPGMQNPEMKGKKSGLDNVWQFPDDQPTPYQQRVLLSKMARIGISVLWTNFMYEFGGEVYIQMEGGPIGARCTMAASRLVMQTWSEGYQAILDVSGVTTDALKGYVDDGRQWGDLMRRGTRFHPKRKRFTWREDWEEEDNKENLKDEVRMAKICLPAMNSVNSDLTFTVETVYNFKNKRLATLDFEAEVIENQVVYSYFQKPMKSPLVIGEASAMSDHQKFSILSNEVIRRMSNISDSDKISQKERVDIINKFTRELKSSGYTRRRAREIVVCGLLGLERKGIRRKREGQSFHRKGKNTLHKRNLQKLNGKSSWFKNKPVDKDEEKQKKKKQRKAEQGEDEESC